MASMTTWAQNRLPSLRTRQPSFSDRPSRSTVSNAFCGSPSFPIFNRVEFREVISDDFPGQITFDAARTKVPVGHNAFCVEHVNGVVGNSLHQQPELLLALL